MRAHLRVTASDEELMRISADNPGWKFERAANGELIVTPPAGAKTSARNARLTSMIFEWADSHGYIAFDSSGGFRLSDTSVIGPDAALVTKEAWEKLTDDQGEGFYPGAPAVAIELCSSSDNPRELRAKLDRIRKAGASYVVLIDPYRGTIWTDGVAPEAFDLDFEQLVH